MNFKRLSHLVTSSEEFQVMKKCRMAADSEGQRLASHVLRAGSGFIERQKLFPDFGICDCLSDQERI